MKYAIISVTVFALTCIGWTTVLVKRAPLPVVTAAADTAAAEPEETPDVQEVAYATPAPVEEPPDTVHAPDAPHDEEPVEDAATQDTSDAQPVAQPTDVATRPAEADAAPPTLPAPVVAMGPTEEEKQAAYKALARIFSQMKAEEAAEVLRHMSDVEVEGVVRNLGARKAAEVLTSLPEQRAAVLARRLLIPVNESSR